jgi:aspartyl/asparaginyl beta-hydroxylase (cupin superfamily)
MFKQRIRTQEIVQESLCKQLSKEIMADVRTVNAGIVELSIAGQTNWYYPSDKEPKLPNCATVQPTTEEEAIELFERNKLLAEELERVHNYLRSHVWQ